MVFELLKNNEIKKNPDNIHDEFMEPFNEKGIILGIKEPGKIESKYADHIYHHRKLSNGLEYNIFLKKASFDESTKKENGRVFDFFLTKRKDEKKFAELRFTEEELEGEQCLNLHHRKMYPKTKEEFGISGSDFFKKSEEYFSILKKNGVINVEKYKAFASQYSVLLWLVKNNFNFSEKSEDEYFKCFGLKRGSDGKPILNDEYTLIPFEDRKHGGVKDEYIIKKEFFTNPKYADLRDKYYKDGEGKNLGKKVLIKDPANNMSRGGNVVHDLVEAGLMPRFTLEKDII